MINSNSSAYNNGHGYPDLKSLVTASITIMNSRVLHTEPWWNPTFIWNPSLSSFVQRSFMLPHISQCQQPFLHLQLSFRFEPSPDWKMHITTTLINITMKTAHLFPTIPFLILNYTASLLIHLLSTASKYIVIMRKFSHKSDKEISLAWNRRLRHLLWANTNGKTRAEIPVGLEGRRECIDIQVDVKKSHHSWSQKWKSQVINWL